MPRRNRVDPWGDLWAVPERGRFTGNRGCVVDDSERVVRHHGSSLWITCLLSYKGWRWPLARPRRWTPLFFLDDAVALAAGHRPCGLCRHDAYQSYRSAVGPTLRAKELDRRLSAERLRRGRGLERAGDRILWTSAVGDLPAGTVIVEDGAALLLRDGSARAFGWDGWGDPRPAPVGDVQVLTPPTSVEALAHGFDPMLA